MTIEPPFGPPYGDRDRNVTPGTPGTGPGTGISVALCTYNGELYLAEQLQSIAAQTRLPDEVVISDDCSTDRTLKICRDFAAEAGFPVSISVNDVRLGSTKNFEKAIGLCSGDVIALCDQDDVWHPEKIAALSAAFLEHPDLDALFSDAELVREGLEPMGLLLWDKSTTFFPVGSRKLVREGHALEVLLRHNVATGMTMAFRARFREVLLPIPAEWMHDHWIGLVIAVFGRVGMVERPLAKYRQHAANQAGGRRLTFWGKVRGALQAPPSAYDRQFEQFMMLRRRVAEASARPAAPDALSKIDSKLSHLRVRGHLPGSLFRRVVPIARELSTGHYQRYSKGVYSSIVDLLFKAT